MPTDLDGSRRRIRRGGYPSRGVAEEVLADLRMPAVGDPCAGVVTVGDWLAYWLVSRASPAASTLRSYAAHVRLYLAPYLGPVLLSELSAAHVQAMFTAIIRHHQALGTPLSAATLNRIPATLRVALNAAARRGLVCENAASRAELPWARRPRAVIWTPECVEHWWCTGERPEVAVWTAAQTARFLTAARGHRLYAVYHLIALRGLRRGEAAGLRWCDVDLASGTVVISQQLQQHGGRLEVTPPKTPYVFTNRHGGPMAPDRLTRLFRVLAEQAGLPPVRLHDLRHGAATLALSAGVDLRTVQDMLGHSSIVLTADTYISVVPELARDAAEKIAALVIEAGCLVPGTRKRRRRDTGRAKGRGNTRRPPGRRSHAHPARQLGQPHRRDRAGLR